MRRPTHVAELVARLVEAKTPEGGPRAPGRRTFEVFRAFERIGPPLTDQAEPSAFRRGRLTLRVRSPAWLTELSMMQSQLVARINAHLPKRWVEEVRLVLGSPRPRRTDPPAPPTPLERLSARQREQVDAWCAHLQNDEVRSAFARAAACSLAGGPPRRWPGEGPPGPRVVALEPSEDAEAEPELRYGYGDRQTDRWTLRRRETPAGDDE
jgi:hypothetical protein